MNIINLYDKRPLEIKVGMLLRIKGFILTQKVEHDVIGQIFKVCNVNQCGRPFQCKFCRTNGIEIYLEDPEEPNYPYCSCALKLETLDKRDVIL